jgi:hypothetical protein
VGWCSGTQVFDAAMEIIEKVVKEFSGPAAGEQSITDYVDDLIRDDVRKFAQFLRDQDWDCTSESEYYERFAQEIEGWTDDEYYDYLKESLREEYSGVKYEKFLAFKAKIGRTGEITPHA